MRKQKLFNLLMGFVLMLSFVCSVVRFNTRTAYADSSPTIVQSGTIEGTDVHYELDEKGLLVVSGTGEIPDDYEGHELAWKEWKEDIHVIVIENGITSIGVSAFADYDNLEKVSLDLSVSVINQSAFAGCDNLRNIVFPETMSWIGTGAFLGCISLEEIELPNGIAVLNGGLFSNCTNLTSVTIPNSVTEFEENVFFGCESLKSLKLPKGLTKIDKDYSFNGSSFEKIYIPCDSEFEFKSNEYAVKYTGGKTTYLSETGVEVIKSHEFGKWETIEGGNKQRKCECGFIETNSLDGRFNKNGEKSKEGGVGLGTVAIVLVIIFALAIGMVWLARKQRNRYYH